MSKNHHIIEIAGELRHSTEKAHSACTGRHNHVVRALVSRKPAAHSLIGYGGNAAIQLGQLHGELLVVGLRTVAQNVQRHLLTQ